MTSFPTSKIELHQWFNSILLGVVGFFVVQTYMTIKEDHEVIARHETRISVVEANASNCSLSLNNLIGRVSVLSDTKANK